MKGHWSLSTKEICLCTFAQCSPRTAQAGCGQGQFMHVVCICITNSASTYDNHLLMMKCMSDKGERKQVRSCFRMGEGETTRITKYFRDGHHRTCIMFSSSSRFNTVDVSTIVILVDDCTALWASQQHANLPAVVRRIAVYPAKLMCGGKCYSVVCVHDAVYM